MFNFNIMSSDDWLLLAIGVGVIYWIVKANEEKPDPPRAEPLSGARYPSPYTSNVHLNPPHLLDLIRRAINEGCNVKFEYEDAEGESTHRLVMPESIDYRHDNQVAMLVGHCCLRGAGRHFVVRRMSNIQLTLEDCDDFEPPEEVNPAEQWSLAGQRIRHSKISPACLREVERHHEYSTWEEASPLALFGYSVGKTSHLSARERREFLEDYVKNLELPAFLPRHVHSKWGKAGSSQRRSHTISHLEYLVRHRSYADARKYASAIADWESDLQFLRTLQ